MRTLKFKSHIGDDGHLRLDVPTNLPEGDVELVLVIESVSTQKSRYDFSDLAGQLRWAGDALAEQRTLRNEWD